MSRELCGHCHYPVINCVCEDITPVSHQTKVVVLQHPSEVKNAKSTVRLLSLLCNNIEVVVGEKSQDFAELQRDVAYKPEQYLILYPSEKSRNWQQWQAYWQQSSRPLECELPNKPTSQKTLIVIDGTWKKAKKILFLNPWLENINALKIDNKPSEYDIRHTSISGALSTIEATAYALNAIENTSTAPFLRALDSLKSSFTRQMPEHVKSRYKKG
ncbi:MAG: DTW domain-containing protein [Gammaproteobacteria bacterium]|nr:DTW domain-containing protein [Gammaproteobacteria bacterium]